MEEILEKQIERQHIINR